MKIWYTFVTFCVLCGVNIGNAKRGFILTSPKILEAGRTVYFTLSVFDGPPGAEVTVRLLRNATSMLAERKVKVPSNQNMWVEMYVPQIDDLIRAKVHIFGHFNNGYSINRIGDVRIVRSFNITLIQTDKPLYRPEDTVRFRVLRMDSDLKTLEKDAMAEIWIEDPDGRRVSQWKNVIFETSMLQLDQPLPEKPSFGIWTIMCLINNLTSMQNFKVGDYVLPNFEVKIKSPYVLDRTEEIAIEICAWYTYGKNVKGLLRANITVKTPWATYRPIEFSKKISGCVPVVVKRKDLSSGPFIFPSGFSSIEVYAEVKEKGTGMIANKTIEIESEVLLEPFKLKFLNAVEDKDYFKPGIPYSGAMLVQTNNGTPAASVKVTVCGAEKQCPTFISDKNGIIRFTFNPINETIYSVDITAKVVDPFYQFHWLYRSVQTRLSLIAWYSPSDSYIQIEPITEELECGKVQSVTIRYTAKEGDSFQFHHQILSRGRIVQQGSHPRKVYSKDDALLNHSSILLPNVREFALTFNLIASMSPIARLLVFYVREDGEIVADSKMFRTQKCWENKVKLGLYHQQQSRRTEDAKATVMLSASPFSICSVGLVDKRLQLFGEEERFSKDKLFKWLEKHDVSSSTEPRRLRENICDQYYSESGTRPHISLTLRNFEEFYNSYGFEDERADSVDAFERAGTMVISDLRLETRPCMNEIERATSKARELSDSLQDVYFALHPDEHLYRGISHQRLILPDEDVEELSDNKISGSAPISAEEIRSYFPETWLWELHTTDSKGEIIVKRQLPHTITEWVGEAMCIHSNTGLGFSETSSIISFQPFFVSLQLPDSVVRYEIVPISVYVISYMTECLPVKIFLESSEDYKFTPEYPSHKMCVCNSDYHLFMVHFASLGKVNITAYGFSIEDDEICGNEATARFSASDAIMRQLYVKAKEEIYYSTCPKDVCGCILHGENGNITSPSYPDLYPPNQNCVWEIVAPPLFIVILNFTHFNLEGSSSGDCLYDKVEIHSRTSVENDQKLEGIYCGKTRPPVLRSKRNVLRITFKSDRAVQMSGFAAEFFTDLNECDSENGGCRQICRNTDGSYECACHSGFILHPNGHDCLDVNECAIENGGCQQICRNKPGSFQCLCRNGFQLLPNERDCEDLNECAYGNGGCQQKCENVIGSYLCSCHEGFSLLPNKHDCQKELGICASGNGGCQQICHKTVGSHYCSCREGFHLLPNGRDCIKATCVHHMTSTEGVVSSPEYINYYPRMIACTWKFETAPGHRIKLVFDIFKVEADEDCVMLYIGNSSNSPLLDRFCGNSEPYEFISPSHILFMSFYSHAATWKTRFQATYSSVCGGHLTAGEDPSFLYSHAKYGEQNYGNHVVCNWLVTSSKIRRVWISFKTFDLEQDEDCEKDYIEIFDGFTETSPKLATFCGTEIPPDIHSTGDGIFIRFHSNYAIIGRGFALTYEEIFDSLSSMDIPSGKTCP